MSIALFLCHSRDGFEEIDFSPDLRPDNPKYHLWTKSFQADASSWFKKNTENPLNRNKVEPPKAVVVFSSPWSPLSHWSSQLKLNDLLRSIVAALPLNTTARKVTSFVDFHSLARIDECGFSHSFPYREYQFVNPRNHNQVGDLCLFTRPFHFINQKGGLLLFFFFQGQQVWPPNQAQRRPFLWWRIPPSH